MTQGNSLLGKFHLNEKRRLSQDTVRMCQTHLSSWALSADSLVSVSKQQFADCDTTDMGCNEGLMDYTSVFAEKIASTSRYTGYKPDNESSGLKHWRIHEHVNRPLVDWTTKGGCASEVSGAV